MDCIGEFQFLVIKWKSWHKMFWHQYIKNSLELKIRSHLSLSFCTFAFFDRSLFCAKMKSEQESILRKKEENIVSSENQYPMQFSPNWALLFTLMYDHEYLVCIGQKSCRYIILFIRILLIKAMLEKGTEIFSYANLPFYAHVYQL